MLFRFGDEKKREQPYISDEELKENMKLPMTILAFFLCAIVLGYLISLFI